MRILLESARPHTIPLGALVASVALHAAFGVPVWQEAVDSSLEVRPESFITRALFIPPPDRRRSSAAPGERISWARLSAVGTGLYVVADGAGARLPDASSASAFPRDEIVLASMTGDAPELTGGDTAYSIFEVDETVTRMANADAPMYPNDLLEMRLEGVVSMRYVVTSHGVVDTATAKVLASTHPHFTRAVLAALAGMRFEPAKIDGSAVSQLVEQEFAFRIRPPDVASVPEGNSSPGG